MTDQPRPILRTGQDARHPWPNGCYIQGGSSGLVLARDGNHYTTAFVEAFPRNPDTFIRGEGATVADAEDAAWAKYQSYLACPGHEYEARGYTNGAGFCRHCSMFASDVFTAEQLGQYCAVCQTPTKRQSAGGAWYCQTHELPRPEVRAADAAAGITPGPLQALFDALLADNDPDSSTVQPT